MTTIYLMRHSRSIKPININNTDSLQLQNEKWCLTKEGEKLAEEKSNQEELKNFDIVYSSNYVRAMDTAKYFSDEIHIDESFGERKFGINSWEELPEDFGKKQFENFNYKIGNGESLNEVIKREEQALEKILKNHKNKKILIVGHSTALASLLSKWCEVNYENGYKFNGEVFFDGKWKNCETFKLTFDKDILTNIENVK